MYTLMKPGKKAQVDEFVVSPNSDIAATATRSFVNRLELLDIVQKRRAEILSGKVTTIKWNEIKEFVCR